MNKLEKIHEVTINNALQTLRFSSEKELKLFYYLIKDFNYFKKYSEVCKDIPISRYYYNNVKSYIEEECEK